MESKSYNFSSIKFSDLEEFVSVRPKLNPQKFDEWFNFDYSLNENETQILADLIKRHQLLLTSYQEEDLKMKFLSPIFYQVNFQTENFRDWYESKIQGEINHVKINGFADFMVATGIREPRKPYFFIQEFKPSTPDKDPEVQLLAELLIAIEKNQAQIMRGGYIIGQNWRFVILEKIGENAYEYFVSDQLDSLNLAHLKQIYVCLQAVKLKYCQD